MVDDTALYLYTDTEQLLGLCETAARVCRDRDVSPRAAAVAAVADWLEGRGAGFMADADMCDDGRVYRQLSTEARRLRDYARRLRMATEAGDGA